MARRRGAAPPLKRAGDPAGQAYRNRTARDGFHGTTKTGLGEGPFAIRTGHEVDEHQATAGLFDSRRGDRVAVHGVAGFRKRHGADLLARTVRVGDVHQAGVGLTGDHLAQYIGGRRLLTDRPASGLRRLAPSGPRRRIGTAGVTTVTPRFVRSASEAMPLGFPDP